MASFAGCSFGENPGATEFPHPSAKAAYTIHTLAGGGQVVDLSGQIERTLTITALCTADEVTAIKSKVGSVGTLILGSGSYSNCLLEEVGKPVEVYASGRYTVALAFTVGVTSTQVISISVLVAGVRVSNVVSLSTSVGKSQGVSTASVTCLSAPSGVPGDAVIIYASVNGSTPTAIYVGVFDALSYDYYPGMVTVECKGKLARLSLPWGNEVERVYSDSGGNGTDDGIITNLIEAWGYAPGDHDIESSSWTLGTIQELVIKKGDIFADVISRIDEVAGYYTYDNLNGAITRRQQQPYGAGGSSVATFTQGTPGILKIARKRGSPASIVNQAIVEGLTYEGIEVKQTYQATSSILDAMAPGTAPNYRSKSLKSDLIEDDVKALAVATRIVTDGNRLADGVEVTTILNLDVLPGVTVTVQSVKAGISSPTRFVVDQVKHSVQGVTGLTTFTTNIGDLT